mmetsp:Transcript_3696/g.14477  ORF Transcript_3696/g.14477 Transcript_3696/m.14477 type:complete len:228 (-) Transcript_3696:184-867(-)
MTSSPRSAAPSPRARHRRKLPRRPRRRRRPRAAAAASRCLLSTWATFAKRPPRRAALGPKPGGRSSRRRPHRPSRPGTPTTTRPTCMPRCAPSERSRRPTPKRRSPRKRRTARRSRNSRRAECLHGPTTTRERIGASFCRTAEGSSGKISMSPHSLPARKSTLTLHTTIRGGAIQADGTTQASRGADTNGGVGGRRRRRGRERPPRRWRRGRRGGGIETTDRPARHS